VITEANQDSEEKGAGLLVQLFLAGDSVQTRMVLERVEKLAASAFQPPYRIEVINVFEQPELADLANILVTPTLLIRTGTSERRLVGDLSDAAKLQLVLSEN
jgi:circadian clock protein KaiB